MTVRKVIRMGHPSLRRVAQNVDPNWIGSEEFNTLIDDMFETMESYGGIGLAAPQIDIDKKICVILLPEENDRYGELESSTRFIMSNPEIEVISPETAGFWEGCLSVPGLRGYVERPQKVKVTYLNEDSEQKEVILEGFLATVFQHELDHLWGKLYIDRLKSPELLSYQEEFDQFIALPIKA